MTESLGLWGAASETRLIVRSVETGFEGGTTGEIDGEKRDVNLKDGGVGDEEVTTTVGDRGGRVGPSTDVCGRTGRGGSWVETPLSGDDRG